MALVGIVTFQRHILPVWRTFLSSLQVHLFFRLLFVGSYVLLLRNKRNITSHQYLLRTVMEVHHLRGAPIPSAIRILLLLYAIYSACVPRLFRLYHRC